MKYFYLPLLVLLIVGCKNGNPEIPDTAITIAGSESELPLIKAFALAYQRENPEQHIEISGGGSNVGIHKLLAGEISIANSSRPLSMDDLEAAATQGINLRQVMIAQDILVIITNPSVGINKLNTQEIADIYEGRVRDWNQLGGNEGAIYPVGRKEGSGTREYFMTRLGVKHFTTAALEFKSYEDIINYVSTTKGAVGYVSARFISNSQGAPNSNIVLLDIAIPEMPHFSPLDKQAVEYGDYPLTRPLYQIYRWPLAEKERLFLEFELSSKTQELCAAQGYRALNENQREINRRRSDLFTQKK